MATNYKFSQASERLQLLFIPSRRVLLSLVSAGVTLGFQTRAARSPSDVAFPSPQLEEIGAQRACSCLGQQRGMSAPFL